MRLRSYVVPAWAKKLIQEISTEEHIRSPRVVWMKRNDRQESSARAWTNEIRFVAGSNRRYAKEVLIHEMCHVILGQKGAFRGNRGHGAAFYAKLFEVGKRHRVGVAFIKQREMWYKPRGVKAGYRLYLKTR